MPATSTLVDVASLATIRSRFPSLARTEGGLPVAYFDGPGGTQVPGAVVDAMADYLLHHNANTHWVYPTSVETDARIAAAREALADFLGGDASEIVFGPNMTTLTFHLGRALARSWKEGDEVVVTELDHHANVDPWRALAKEKGVVIRTAPLLAGRALLDVDALGRLLSKRTRLVAVGAASNAVGTINDVARIAEMAHAAGARVFVDAVHYAPHELVDVKALGADFLACSPYKFYGPHMGVLWGKKSLLEALDAPKLAPAPEEAPDRLETGTQNHEGIAGCLAAVEFLVSLASGAAPRRARLERVFAAFHERGDALLLRVWEGLSAIRGVTLCGPPPGQPRTPTVAFALQGHTSEEVARALVPRGAYVSNGDFYASTLVERLGHGRDGLVRAGAACYTTEDEVDRLVVGVREIARA